MTETNILSRYKNERSFINKVNDGIVIFTITAMVIWIITMYVNLGINGASEDITNSVVGDAFIIPLMALAALAGVVSVVASNNKMPITLLVLSTIATLYKLLYGVIQMTSGAEAINSSVIIGQGIMFFTLMIQVYLWLRWNKETDEGKFITQAFRGWRTLIAVIFIAIVFIIQLSFSLIINGGNFFAVFMDVSGAMLYTTASILMAFGNIFCFLFFFLSDLNWLYWTITDLVNTDNALMMSMAITTLIQVLAYTALAVTGFIQWFMDDFELEGIKPVRKNRNINDK